MKAATLRRSPKPYLLLAILATSAAAWLPLAPTFLPLLDPRELGAFFEPRLLGLMGRTLWISAGAAALAALCGVPLGLLASRVRLPGRALLGMSLPLPLLLPPLLIAQAWHGLSGMDGPYAALFSLGLAYAPFPALFTAHALRHQGAAAHDAALLGGGPRFALREMLRSALPGATLGAVLAFLFAATDFAVPDYFAFVGDKFSVYAAEVFNAFRDADFLNGAGRAAPLVLVAALLLYACLELRDRLGAAEGNGRPPALLCPTRGVRGSLTFLALGLVVLLLGLPLGRILWETGAHGGSGGWTARSLGAFQRAFALGGGDLARSLASGGAAGLFALVIAPIWARLLVHGRPGPGKRLLQILLALPLLAPGVGFGLGAVVVYNQPLFGDFYTSPLLPPLLLAGRYLPIAVFVLAERLQRVPSIQDDAALLGGSSFGARLYRYLLGPQRSSWFLAAGLVTVFAVRELDLAILIPAANASAAVRYYNALHFARDEFVAAFGLVISLVLFLPVMLAHAFAPRAATDR